MSLRDDMRAAAKDAVGLRDNFFGELSDPAVDAILATPAMQAIKAVVRADVHLDHWCCAECRDDYIDRNAIPISVVEWAST